jgi:hypothetical protein
MDELKVAKPLTEEDWGALLQRENPEAKRAAWMAKYVDTFDTGRQCHCGKPIVDHVSVYNPHRSPSETMFGPGPDNYGRDYFTSPSLVHEYYCDDCGLQYHASVVEKEYIPHEKRDPAA